MHAPLLHTIVVVRLHLHAPYFIIMHAPPPTLLQHSTCTPLCTTLFDFIVQDFISQIITAKLHCALDHASHLLDLIVVTLLSYTQ
jgi:hypothetical protein